MGRWRTGAVQLVGDVDLHAAASFCAHNPVGSVLAASRIESALAAGIERGGGSAWAVERDGRMVGLCWAGANLVPVCHPDDDETLDALADAAARRGRRCSSIVGDSEVVLRIWDRLREDWPSPREIRADQPSLVIDRPPTVPADPAVRVARPDELGVLMPASVQMFIEEVGYSPLSGGSSAYEARVRSLLAAGHTYVRVEDGPDGPETVFKADLGAVSSRVAQVQGVWVAPRLRGRRISEHGMAAVVDQALGRVAPVLSLYVNRYNTRALASYLRVGFREVGRYATVLF